MNTAKRPIVNVGQTCNLLVAVRIASSCEDFPSAQKWPASRHGAKRLECEQLAAAVERGQTVVYSRPVGNPVAVESGSKLLALQTLRAIRVLEKYPRFADYKSAIQQITNLRYFDWQL